MCNECGNCETFCPWASAPYKDKFTLFSTEKEFDESKNSGFLLLSGSKYKLRYEGAVFTEDLSSGSQKIPAKLVALILNATISIPL